MESVYPWHQVASDIAASVGMTADSELQMATELNRDIQAGEIQCWNAAGDPIRGGIPLEDQRRRVPHLTAEAGNEWLVRRGYLHRWVPVQPVAGQISINTDYSMLATPQELIDAFGKFTGMDHSWFLNLKDRPKLKAARKVAGQGGRGHYKEPHFCPYAVMDWLVTPPRQRSGRKPMQADTGWRMLEQHFPKVFNAYEAGDTRAD